MENMEGMENMDPAAAGAAAGGLGVVMFVYLAIMVLMIASYWKLFTKAGRPGWACLIPIYNAVVMLQIVRKPVWWLLLFLVPIVNIVIAIILVVELAKAYGKGAGYALGLLFLGIVFYPMLAFGDAQYQYGAPAPAQAAAA